MTSKRPTDARSSAFLALAALLFAAACGGSGGYGTGPVDNGGGGGGGGTGGRTTSIDMTSNLTFVPKVDTVTAGQTVTWTTQGSTPHTATSDTGLWDSGNVGSGQSFSHTFTDVGTYPYHCSYHQGSGMVGTIVVIAP